MAWSWRLVRIAGIDVYVHATFAIFLAWIALAHVLAGQNADAVASALIFVLAIFSIIVLHELGHALMARRFGIVTRDITLLPIGGVARLERMPDRPWQELLVALAGPAVNVVLALGLFLAIGVAGGSPAVPTGANAPFLVRILWVNIALAVFNLLPAFPMDGGRALRAVLAMGTDPLRATEIAAHLGQGMALLFGFLGLMWNPFLLFIAFFVWVGAAAEVSMAQLKSALAGIPVSYAMITDFRVLSPRDPLSSAVELIMAGFQEDFPVVLEGRLVGILTKEEVVRALARGGHDAAVDAAMQTQVSTADPQEMLEGALGRLRASAGRSLPVVRGTEVVGLLTAENVGELLMLRAALQKGGRGTGTRLDARGLVAAT